MRCRERIVEQRWELLLRSAANRHRSIIGVAAEGIGMLYAGSPAGLGSLLTGTTL